MAQGLGSPLTAQPSRGHLDETDCLLPEVSPRHSGGPVATARLGRGTPSMERPASYSPRTTAL